MYRIKNYSLRMVGLLLTLFLAACGMTEPSQPTTFSHVLTIPLSPGDTAAVLEQRYQGRVIVVTDTHAVVAVNDLAGLNLQSGTSVETNSNSFMAGADSPNPGMNGRSEAWAGGRSEAWAGGRSEAWAGGTSELWQDGEFLWMPENTALWQQLNLREGHALAQNLGLGIKVAVIDTGVDLQHPALVEALAPQNEWFDFYDRNAQPQEAGSYDDRGYGHGTNVAGIIRQVAPRATILPIRVLGPDGSGTVLHLAEAIVWAVEQGADVINLSLGSSSMSFAVESAISYAAARGVFVIASAGNSGENRVTYPASAANNAFTGRQRLSVTSVNAQDMRSTFANFGTAIEIAAPGENVYGPAPEEQLAAWSGTSMAAPIVSGAIALALGETLSVAQRNLVQEVKRHSFNHYSNGLNDSYLNLLGQGRLDFETFLTRVIQ